MRAPSLRVHPPFKFNCYRHVKPLSGAAHRFLIFLVHTHSRGRIIDGGGRYLRLFAAGGTLEIL